MLKNLFKSFKQLLSLWKLKNRKLRETCITWGNHFRLFSYKFSTHIHLCRPLKSVQSQNQRYNSLKVLSVF